MDRSFVVMLRGSFRVVASSAFNLFILKWEQKLCPIQLIKIEVYKKLKGAIQHSLNRPELNYSCTLRPGLASYFIFIKEPMVVRACL
jgi:hypothetical protein